MGTTQRIIPGVTGEPNWKELSTAVTNIGKTVEKEKGLEDSGKSPNEIARDHINIQSSRSNHLKSGFSSLVKTGGGSRKIATGKSSSIGKAGIRTAGKFVSFLTGVSNSGLAQTLSEHGFNSQTGKSVQEVVDFILVYCSDSSVGMDETAASKAVCELLNELAIQADNDLNKFEEVIKGQVDDNALIDLLTRFWGLYIFEHLSQRFQEKMTQMKGEEISKETFKIIKADIMGQVAAVNDNKPVSRIDWNGAEGEQKIESIFESIINILS